MQVANTDIHHSQVGVRKLGLQIREVSGAYVLSRVRDREEEEGLWIIRAGCGVLSQGHHLWSKETALTLLKRRQSLPSIWRRKRKIGKRKGKGKRKRKEEKERGKEGKATFSDIFLFTKLERGRGGTNWDYFPMEARNERSPWLSIPRLAKVLVQLFCGLAHIY